MQKSKNILLILSAEEREEAKRFIKRRFKILDPEQLSQLQILSQLTKQIVRRTQIDKGQYARNPSRAGKLLTKLHEAALVDMQAIIKDLAQQTNDAIDEIRTSVDAIQESTEDTVSNIGQISGVINQVNDIVGSIASAVEEQSVTTQDIAQNVNQAAVGIQGVNENVNQAATASGTIAQDIALVDQVSSEVETAVVQVKVRATELSEMGKQLNEIVGNFKI